MFVQLLLRKYSIIACRINEEWRNCWLTPRASAHWQSLGVKAIRCQFIFTPKPDITSHRDRRALFLPTTFLNMTGITILEFQLQILEAIQFALMPSITFCPTWRLRDFWDFFNVFLPNFSRLLHRRMWAHTAWRSIVYSSPYTTWGDIPTDDTLFSFLEDNAGW